MSSASGRRFSTWCRMKSATWRSRRRRPMQATGFRVCRPAPVGTSSGERQGGPMAKDHGSSVKKDKQYEGLRKKGMSKSRAAAISNANAGSDNAASKKGGKRSGGGSTGGSQSSQSSGSGSGGNRAQKQAAGRKGGKASS